MVTDGIAWPFLEYTGTPLSPESSLVEHFTPSADGMRLSYSVVVTDPQYLTTSVTLTRSWVARPNESVKPYKCGAPAESTRTRQRRTERDQSLRRRLICALQVCMTVTQRVAVAAIDVPLIP